jgi:hypothetical protein
VVGVERGFFCSFAATDWSFAARQDFRRGGILEALARQRIARGIEIVADVPRRKPLGVDHGIEATSLGH